MSKLKYNTSKIINLHVVLKIHRNRRLTHTNFYFVQIFFKRKIVKSNTFQKYELSFVSTKYQNYSITQEKYSVFMLVIKVLRNRRLTHANFYFFNKFTEIQKEKSNTLAIYQLSKFLKNVKIEV